MTAVGYARVSTKDQALDPQLDALARAGAERTFHDVASGKLASRPRLDAALDYLRRGDTLVITKLDRLGRSIAHLVQLAAVLRERGIELRVIDQGIDTSTPGGRLFFHILASIAEFERELIGERTRDGLTAARARGRRGGRPLVMDAARTALAQKMYDEQVPVIEIARRLRVARGTLYRHLQTGVRSG